MDGNTVFIYLNGTLINSASFSGTIHTSGNANTLIGRAIGYNDLYWPGYMDEARWTIGSADKPQIKWTHTQTAGAGNKDAYDVHGWRAHGHEFSDDNATSLLVHGDSWLADNADSWYSLDGTNDYIVVPSGISGTAVTAFTIATWIKCDEYTNTSEGIYAGNVSTASDYNFYLGLGTSGGNSFDFRVKNGTNNGDEVNIFTNIDMLRLIGKAKSD